MTMLGQGAVAIWHDIAAEGRDDFYAWHGQEHMPERVGIEGFNRGRRFIAIDADREFFNLYETRDADVVKSAAYLARLERPTPWTLSTVRHFRHVARSLCGVLASTGDADGGTVATLRLAASDAADAVRLADDLASLARRLAPLPGIAAVHVLAADVAASGYANAEQRARGTENEIPTHMLIIEGWADEAAFMETVRAHAGGRGTLGFYRHQITTWPRPGPPSR
jgi:hypothetical protein